MNYLSLFSGIGAPEKALKELGISYNLLNYCEIDKYASRTYAAVHNISESLNLWDVRAITKDTIREPIDLITHGSPCQSFSIAGKQAGGDEGSGTPSSLMYETLRIVGDYKPKVVLWENVKNVLSKKHRHNFDNYLARMDSLGYNSYYAVLDSRNFGIPQHRERLFCISIRKDLDEGFVIPAFVECSCGMRTFLLSETEVSENYRLDMTLLKKAEPYEISYAEQRVAVYDIPEMVRVRKYPVDEKRLAEMLRCCKQESHLTNSDISRVLNVPVTMVEHWFRKDKYFAAPTPELWYRIKNLLSVSVNDFDESIMEFEVREGVFDRSNRVYDEYGLAPTLTCSNSNFRILVRTDTSYYIRRLMPKEAWRLMGFSDEDFERALSVGTADAQLMKQAGNSIVVPVLKTLFLALAESGLLS